MSAKVTVHDHEAATTVVDVSQLDAVLKAACEEAQSKNTLGAIIVEAENGNRMSIAVGDDETVLTFEYWHRNPPYHVSKGVSDSEEPLFTCYLTFQHHSEFPRKNVIRSEEGFEALAQFLDSGKLPTCVRWEEV